MYYNLLTSCFDERFLSESVCFRPQSPFPMTNKIGRSVWTVGRGVLVPEGAAPAYDQEMEALPTTIDAPLPPEGRDTCAL